MLFLIFSGKLGHFQRRWVGDSNIPQAVQSCSCRTWAWAQQSVQSTQAMFVEAPESRVNLQSELSLRWAQCPSHKSHSRPVTQFCCGSSGHVTAKAATHLCQLPSAAQVWAWVDHQEKEAELEEAGLVTQWAEFFPLSQGWVKGCYGGLCCSSCWVWDTTEKPNSQPPISSVTSVILPQQQWHLPPALTTFQCGKCISLTSSSLYDPSETLHSSLLQHNASLRICSISCGLLAVTLAKMACIHIAKLFFHMPLLCISRDILVILLTNAQYFHNC